MKRTTTSMYLKLTLIVSIGLWQGCATEVETNAAMNSYNNADLPPDSLCFAQPSWFPHSTTPAPEEGDGSPFDVSETSNSIFHQWSWQKFLWLTKPDAGGYPLFLNQSKVKQVTSAMLPVAIPTTAKVVLTDIQQAGSSAILYTNPAYSNNNISHKVYYSIHMNNEMFDASQEFAKAIVNGKIPESNDSTFPIGAFELKVSWVQSKAIPSTKKHLYYITKASITTDGGKNFYLEEVALVGMHVVGVVKNHPEFIWATFEHDDLAPDYDWAANAAQSSDQTLLFAKGQTSGLGGITYNSSTQLGNPPHMVYDLFQYGVPRNFGGGFMDNTSQSEPVNFNNIDGINQCVKSQLDDVWKNYFYNGSLWINTDGTNLQRQAFIIDSLGFYIGEADSGSFARGSLNCANVTMETFTQTFQTDIKSIAADNLANCFSCHYSPSHANYKNTSPLYLSHVFQDYLNSQKGMSLEEVEAIKAKSEKQLLLRRSMKK